LALASAASFLERTSFSVQEYLDEYDENWVDEEDSSNLLEYGDRTLFTTWNMSLEKIKSQDPHTAELLRILAFFSNENIYYELLAADDEGLWPGLGDILSTKSRFHRTMARLGDYSLVETTSRGYRLHPCVHDWTLSSLNPEIDESDLWRAINCTAVAGAAEYENWENWENKDGGNPQAGLVSHAMRLMHPQLYAVLEKSELDESRCHELCEFLSVLALARTAQGATPLLERGFSWCRENLGEEDQGFLYMCNVFGLAQQGLENYDRAESLLRQAIDGRARTLGKHAQLTLDPVHNLALMYTELERYDEAEELYLWSLEGCKESYGPLDVNTFWAMMALADFHEAKEEPEEVEKYLRQALEGFEAAEDSDHYMSRRAAARLGAIYEQKRDYDAAAAMFQRVYDGCWRVYGPDHWTTLEAQDDLNNLERKSRWGTGSRSPSTLVELVTGDTDVKGSKLSDEKADAKNS